MQTPEYVENLLKMAGKKGEARREMARELKMPDYWTVLERQVDWFYLKKLAEKLVGEINAEEFKKSIICSDCPVKVCEAEVTECYKLAEQINYFEEAM
ncbi:hypothetical protein [Halarsenatibacter silvermanii]|uniref:Uncharacterized protein n=1 Tax=Halarsenatibacter silvermanii TaxID=321763 RepID=A0A1G9NKT4_9FIRM|nr:hypothetical protein [Halarsenatibacter silvermanii]SDL87216.1 hypothetical protein SAMN04488692_110114 [Halarsenatibacter silvermanii]